MPLVNRAVDLEPSRAYSTASRREMQRRLDRSYRVIERILSARISRFDKAKSDLNSIRTLTSEAHAQIADWNTSHKGVKKLRERMPGSLYTTSYPWTFSGTAKQYQKYTGQRLAKHRAKLRESIDDLRAYVDQFNDRYAFIQKGFAWLKINPPKVNLVSEVQAAFADLFATEVIDGFERLVLKDAEILEAGEIVRRDIVSSDSAEMIVSKPSEALAVRKASGIEVRNKRIDDGALVGDGVDDRDVFEIAAKMSEPDYLDAAIRLHYYKSGVADHQIDSFSGAFPQKLYVDFDRFLQNRDQATDFYKTRSDLLSLDSSRVSHDMNGRFATYVVKNPIYPYCSSDLPEKVFKEKVKRASLPKDLRYVEDVQSGPFPFAFRRGSGLSSAPDIFANVLTSVSTGCPTILSGGPGSGKTTLISYFVSSMTQNGAVVKIIGGGGSLDVIKENILRAMSDRRLGLDVSIDRFDDHMMIRHLNRDKLRYWPDCFKREGHHVTIIDEASLVDMRDEFLDPAVALLVVGDLFQISKEGSVLDWAERSNFPLYTLTKNHRAQNADIMAWSSIFRYGSSVMTMQHGQRLSGIRYVPMARKVNGVVMAEARAVSNGAIAAMDKGGSAAVVAFSKKQLLAILDCMGTEQSARLKFAGLPEDIQGKEADHVFISMGAALTAGGKTPTRINGLEDEMGIARMNVALSRALYSNTIFSGLVEEDIDLRVATASQTILLSVLKVYELLPSEDIISSDPYMNLRSMDSLF